MTSLWKGLSYAMADVLFDLTTVRPSHGIEAVVAGAREEARIPAPIGVA